MIKARQTAESLAHGLLGAAAGNGHCCSVGVRMTEPPITPERVLKALADKSAEG